MENKLNLEFIKERRLRLGFTLEEMADELGYKNASTYFNYEKGVCDFKANQLPIICSKLNCTLNELFLYPSFAKIAN
ncbi:helix-turn-helix domain-containing protein [Gottfriedia endophytica]|nr:helix-turn-helix transcriptional regulator [Gottfriedia endophytica]